MFTVCDADSYYPINEVHDLEGEPVRLFVVPEHPSAGWRAIVSCEMKLTTSRCDTIGEANHRARLLFSRLFPRHRCSAKY